MISFFEFLIESEERIAFIKKQNPNLDFSHDAFAKSYFGHLENASDAIIDHLARHDPTPNKAYTQWMVNRYKKKDFTVSGAEHIGQHLAHFHAGSQLLEPALRDINRHDVITMMGASSRAKTLLDQREAQKKAKGDIDHVYKDDTGFSVVSPRTHAAAQSVANLPPGHSSGLNKCKWCTSYSGDSNYFDDYTKTNRSGRGPAGPLYVIKTPDDRRYQIHPNRGELNDERNERVDPGNFARQYPQAKNVKEFKTGPLALHFAQPEEQRQILHKMSEHDVAHLPRVQREHLDPLLADHPNSGVRGYVAARTKDHSAMQKLLHDQDHTVVSKLAENGHAFSHLDQLMAHPHEDVRAAVVSNYGHLPDVNEKSLRDPHPKVRATSVRYAANDQITHLANDPSHEVRREVARNFYQSHSQLVNDPHPEVRKMVSMASGDLDVYHKLKNDPDETVRRQVQHDGRYIRQIQEHFYKHGTPEEKENAIRNLQQHHNWEPPSHPNEGSDEHLKQVYWDYHGAIKGINKIPRRDRHPNNGKFQNFKAQRDSATRQLNSYFPHITPENVRDSTTFSDLLRHHNATKPQTTSSN